jgi:hypothetical protein
MKNKVLVLIAISILVAASSPFVGISNNENENAIGENINMTYSDRIVSVYSEENFASKVKDSLLPQTSNVSHLRTTDTETTEEIIIFDEKWIYKNDTTLVDSKIDSAIRDGCPVIFVGSNSYLTKSSNLKTQVVSHSDYAIAYGIFIDKNGVGYQYSVGNSTEKEAISLLYAWANEITSGKDTQEVVRSFSWMTNNHKPPTKEFVNDPLPLGATSSAYWGLHWVTTQTLPCGNYGDFSHSTLVYKLEEFNDGYKYYSFHYFQSGQPNHSSGYRIADIYLEASHPSHHTIIGHAPSTTSGTQGSSVTVSLGIGMSGFSGGASGSWVYSISDVVLRNTSSMATGKINFWHDVSEDKAVGSGYSVEPTTTIRVPNGKSYNVTDVHKIQMCKEYSVPAFNLIFVISTLLKKEYRDFNMFTMYEGISL